MFHQTESVGETFDVAKLHHAQRVGWRLLNALASRMHPGATLEDAKRGLDAVVAAEGLQKHWHPPQLRLGKNTICHFNEVPVSGAPLGENDIFFLDIGVVVDGYESDVGCTFALGGDPEMSRCADDAKRIHKEGVALWNESRCSGSELYAWTRTRAQQLGWALQEEGANGHRIGDFPHHRFSRTHLVSCDFSPAPDRWIYEVHLRATNGRFGAFFEDLLTW